MSLDEIKKRQHETESELKSIITVKVGEFPWGRFKLDGDVEFKNELDAREFASIINNSGGLAQLFTGREVIGARFTARVLFSLPAIKREFGGR